MKLSVFRRDVPDGLRDLPGVWATKQRAGWLVPFNAITLLGEPTPSGFSEAAEKQALAQVVKSRWLREAKASGTPPLRSYQERMLARALVRPGFSCWGPPGMGKTRVGLHWLAADESGPRLVITRAAIRDTWVEEIQKWTHFVPQTVLGRAARQVTPKADTIYVTAWETIIQWKDALVELRPASLVIDESHWTRRTKRAEPVVLPSGKTIWQPLDNASAAVKAIADASARRLLLTATPIPNKVMDLWPQLDLGEPWAWGGSKSFGIRYCDGHFNGYGMEYTGSSNLDELNERLRFSKCLVRYETLARELPAKSRQVCWIPPEAQDKPAHGFKNAFRAAVAASTERGDDDPLYEILLAEAATRKRSVVVARVVEAWRHGEKVCVFTGRHRDCDDLGVSIFRALPKGSKANFWCAHGGTSIATRTSIRHDYMSARGPAVLVGTGDAWGEGINLQDTDLALVVMLPHTPEKVVQWEGRFARIGQERPVLVQYIVAQGTIDEDVARGLLGKLPPIVELVSADELTVFAKDFKQIPRGSLLDRMAGLQGGA